MPYVARKTKDGFELQINKKGSDVWARIVYGDKIAARFDRAPIAIGLRELYVLFMDFDFSDIFANTDKQSKLLNLVPTKRAAHCV